MKSAVRLAILITALRVAMLPNSHTPANGGPEGNLALASPGPQASSAQGPGKTDSSRDHSAATLHVTTTLVEVSVVARDKHGQLVTDLKQDNFEVYDQGKQQKIQFFTVQRAGPAPAGRVPPAVPPSVASLTSPAGVFSNRNSESFGPNAVTVILIDATSVECEEWPYARDQLMRFLRQVQPGDRIGIYVLLPQGFAIVHDFTQDSSSLVKRLATWNGKVDRAPCFPGYPLAGVGNELNAMLEGTNAPVEVYRAPAPGSLDNLSVAVGSDNPNWNSTVMGLRALAFLARHLAGIPGRKNVVWISNGFPLVGHFTGQTGHDEPTHYGADEQEAMRAANAADVAIYSVETQGLQTLVAGFDQHSTPGQRLEQLKDATTGAAPSNALGQGQGPNPAPPTGINGVPSCVGSPAFGDDVAGDPCVPVGHIWGNRVQAAHDALMATQATLLDVAERTGGRAFINTNDIAGAVRSAFDDSHVTYTLGFYPEAPRFDGKFHTLQVKVVDRPDVSLNYRKGYVDTAGIGDPKRQLEDAVSSPLDANGIALTARMTPTKAGYDLGIAIGLDGLSLKPDGKRWKGTIHLVLVQNDDQGGRYDYFDQTVGLALRKGTYQAALQSGLSFHQAVAPNPKATTLRVIVVDESSGNVGSLTMPVAPSH